MQDHKAVIERLKQNLLLDLPGQDAQFKMAPDPKEYYNRISKDYRSAAVLALIYPHNDLLHLAYILRSVNTADDKHSGQISFPGGKLEETDDSLVACALREAEEEVGIKADNIEVIGQLSDVFVFVSNFMVYPFVAVSDARPDFILDPVEVSEVIEVPIDLLNDEKNSKKIDLRIRSYLLKDVPYYDIEGKVLWGATAMMTSELLALINN